jgi:biotin/methionine sulfoxide reductase
VRGRTDATPKTPQWAETLTGVPAATTGTIAHHIAAGRTLITATWALQRAEYGEQPYWAVIALASCLGQIGLPGGGFGFGYGSTSGVGSVHRPFGTPAFRARRNPCTVRVPVSRLTDLLGDPGGSYEFDGSSYRYPDVRFVYWAGGNPFHHHQDLNRLAEAWQRPDTIVVNEPWWTPTARMADIVLPATTTLERDDISAGSREAYVVAMKRAVARQGQARNDREIFAALAERLGCREDYTDGHDDRQALCAMYERARASAAEHGHVLPGFATFWERGYHRYDLPPAPPPFAAFRADPEQAPLATPSGRIELFSQTVHGYGYDECPGHPMWTPPTEWAGAVSSEAGVGRHRFPIHLLSPQPASRLHSQLDMAEVSTESKIAGREPIALSRADAVERGIADGDLVRIWNDRGETYAGAEVRDDVIAGVALLATGAWYTPHDPRTGNSPDLHGNPNVLTRDVPTSRLTQGSTAQSVLVEVEKAPADAPYRDPHGDPGHPVVVSADVSHSRRLAAVSDPLRSRHGGPRQR